MSFAHKFHQLFHGLNRAYGIYEVNETTAKGKRVGKARTTVGEVTTELWQQHLDGEQSLGIVPINDDNECNFAAIDIDVKFFESDYMDLLGNIKQLQLPLVL